MKLQPHRPIEVAIELSDAMPTDDEVEADLKDLLGMTQVSADQIRQLRRIGVHVKTQGILETQRGAVYVTQAWILGASSEIYRLMRSKTKRENADSISVDDVCKLADQLGKLAGKQAELSAVMSAQEPKGNNKPDPIAPANTPFAAGAVVIGGNAQAHFHQTHPATLAEKSIAPRPDGA